MVLAHLQRPRVTPPAEPQPLAQEAGTRPSRALPCALHADLAVNPEAGTVTIAFENIGKAGAVFHVSDRLDLDRIPRRYTVEAGKRLSDVWAAAGTQGWYDVLVSGERFKHRFAGRIENGAHSISDPALAG